MPAGMDTFSRYFANYKDQYAIIGGSACELLLSDEAMDFRLTRDIDMVLIVEALTKEFMQTFWNFIRQEGYEAWTNQEGTPKFYGFVHPAVENYRPVLKNFFRIGRLSYQQRSRPRPITTAAISGST